MRVNIIATAIREETSVRNNLQANVCFRFVNFKLINENRQHNQIITYRSLDLVI